MPLDCKTVRELFEESQRGFQHHGKLIRCLKRIQNSFSSEEEFRESFVDHLRFAMIVFKREPAVERIVEFVAKYSTAKIHYVNAPEKDDNISDDEDDSDAESTSPFLQFMFRFLLDCHDAKDKGVRFRSCQLINKLLNNMDDEASIDDDIAEDILANMLKRLKDKIPAVRIQAVYALSRLQDPRDDDCPVLSSYIQMMATDSSADVRKAVLLNVALTRQSLAEVIGRTHDVTETVRKVAYRIIGEKVKIQSLSIALRVQLLQDGLNDRSSVIQKVCIKCVLHGWLKSLDGKVVSLLKCLDIENSADTAEIAVKALLKGMGKEELQDQIKSLKSDPNQSGPISIPYDELDCEIAFYWRCLGEHIKSLGVEGEDLLDLLLPEVSMFCQYVQGYTEKEFTSVPEINEGKVMQQTFVAQQLLLLMGVVDLSDEVGRKRLGQLIHDLLVSPFIPESLVEVLLSRHNEVQEEEEARIQELVEVIADVRQPIVMVESNLSQEEERKKELQLASIKVKLIELNDKLENCVNNQDFSEAAELKRQITEVEESRSTINESSASVSMAVREEKDDPVTLLKCLTIACQMLQTTTRNGLNPTLMTLVETLIIPGVQNEDPTVRNAAIKSLGLCALLSCEFARNYLVLFLQVAQLDQEMVQVTALQVVFDLLLKFGLEAFKLNPNKDFLDKEKSNSEKENEDDEEERDEEEGEQKEDGEEENITPDNTATSVLTILTGFLESESNDLRNVAAEGLAKLLLSGRVLSAKLLSRLILLWYNPTTEEDGNLRHCIGVFLPVFAFASRTNQELVEDAFLPTLKTLFSAPTSSPLASINSNNVAELLIELTNSKHLNKDNATGESTATEGCSHVSLALKVANEILSDPQVPGTRVLCKVLTSLDLNGCDQTCIKDLKVLAYKLYETVEEGACTKFLDKFQKNLDQLDKTTDQDEIDEQTVEETTEGSHDSSTQSQDTQPPPIDQAADEAEHDDVPSNENQSNDVDNPDDSLNDSTNTMGNRENEQETAQTEKVISKTPKVKPSDNRNKNTASKTCKSISTAKAGKRSRQKITSKSVSATIKTRLNLSSDSDIEMSDKENSVFQ